MITKITNGSRPGDLAAYLHGPGRQHEHVYDRQVGGAVIGGTLGRDGDREGKGWAVDLREAAAMRPDIAKPIWHMSLRNAAGDRVLTDREWAQVAHEMGTAMGWADKPWVVVRHGDDHVHVVVSRVGDDGSVWNRRDDRYKARRAAVQVEKRHQLTATPVRTSEASKRVSDHQVTQGEHRRATRTARAPERVLLADRVRAAREAAAGYGRQGFEAALDEAGVAWRVNVASTGRVSGYSFHLPGHTDTHGQEVWWKASQLDKTLAWSQTRLVLEDTSRQPRVDVPRKFLEPQARYEQRVQDARVQAFGDKTAAAAGTVLWTDAGRHLWWEARHKLDVKRTQAGRQRADEAAAALARALEARRISQAGFTDEPRPRAPMTPLTPQPAQERPRHHGARDYRPPEPHHGRGIGR